MNQSIAVRTSNLVKTISGVEIIKDCSMTIEAGTIYGLLGANGAGKTSIFKILTGLFEPTAGEVMVLGMDMRKDKIKILRNIGSIIEMPVFYEHLSAIENLELHLAYMGVKGMDLSEVLKMVGLNHINKKPVSDFSLGMRQRLGIARALVHNPKLLVLDEPINGLDPMMIRHMRDLLLILAKEYGKTILISSHILSEVEHIADKVGVIVNGALRQEVSLSAVRKQYAGGLENYFLSMMEGGNINA